MAKVKKTFRLTPEAAKKVESAIDQTEFVEKAILQFSNQKITIPEQKIQGKIIGVKI